VVVLFGVVRVFGVVRGVEVEGRGGIGGTYIYILNHIHF
jgi:hypothetical protein